jgi:nitric oxide reductase subunit B
MFGMTMAFAAAGITQTLLERIMGVGYLETQRKMQVHYLMLVGTGILFVLGVGLYLYDFFIVAPRREHADTRWHSTADVRAAEA